MPASAAALPLTILVLAWDEATPAVRTLIEAAPGLAPASMGPLLVLVPPAPLPAPELVAPVEEPSEPMAVNVPASAQPAAPISLAGTAKVVDTAPEALPIALEAGETASVLAPVTQTAGWTTVRITHLAYSAPKEVSRFAGLAPATWPAAPYLGATPPVAAPTTGATAATAPPALVTRPAAAPSHPAEAPDAAASPLAEAQLLAPAIPMAFTTDEALAPDPEADLLPGQLVQEETPLAPAPPVGASAAFAVTDQAKVIPPDVSDSRSLDAEALAEPTATAPAALGPDALTTSVAPVANATTLATPAAEEPLLAAEEPAATAAEVEPATIASPPLLPAPAHYPASDLNTRVIRYARFAVPAALAEGPFAAIYAPAWPTWLAALELRQRTGCPLVLHLPALAAGREPADTAAGWPAEIQRQALRQADLVLTETYALARRLRRELGLASSIVRVVPAANGSAVARALRRARRREATH